MNLYNSNNRQIPTKVTRSGSFTILLSAILIFIVVFCIKYPEVLEGEITLSTQYPPIPVYPRINGEIDSLHYAEGDTIEAGEIICLVNSQARYRDILLLEKELDEFLTADGQIRPNVQMSDQLVLGPIQSLYANFLEAIKKIHFAERNAHTSKRIEALSKQVEQLKKLNQFLKKSKEVLQQELATIDKNYDRYKQLNANGLVSDMEVEKEEVTRLSYARQLEDLNIRGANNGLQIEQINTEILNLDLTKKELLHNGRLEIIELTKVIRSNIEQWKENYLIHSPIKGVVSMNEVRSNDQYLQTTAPLCYIVPLKQNNEMLGLGQLPTEQFGKLDKDCVVNIKFDNYPYKEYGIVSGKIKNIYLLASSSDEYTVEIEFPDQLMTSYNIELPVQPEMKGEVEIIIDKKNLIDKVLEEINNALKNT